MYCMTKSQITHDTHVLYIQNLKDTLEYEGCGLVMFVQMISCNILRRYCHMHFEN